MTRRTKAELVAYAAALKRLLSWHQQAALQIESKLKILTDRGIIAPKPGDWMEDAELMSCKIIVSEKE